MVAREKPRLRCSSARRQKCSTSHGATRRTADARLRAYERVATLPVQKKPPPAPRWRVSAISISLDREEPSVESTDDYADSTSWTDEPLARAHALTLASTGSKHRATRRSAPRRSLCGAIEHSVQSPSSSVMNAPPSLPLGSTTPLRDPARLRSVAAFVARAAIKPAGCNDLSHRTCNPPDCNRRRACAVGAQSWVSETTSLFDEPTTLLKCADDPTSRSDDSIRGSDKPTGKIDDATCTNRRSDSCSRCIQLFEPLTPARATIDFRR